MIQRLRRLPLHWLLVIIPALYLLVFFVIPNALLLSISFMRTEAQVLTNEVTLENYRSFFSEPFYVGILIRTLWIGVVTGALVVTVAFPIAYFLTRTTSRWQGVLIALSLSPLLASVIVRTYGWFIILHRNGVVNNTLQWLGLIESPLRLMPSSFAIIIGLVHVLLPYGILTIMASLQGVNPNLESAAMSLGANRLQTFFRVLLPLTAPGLAGGFLLTFAISISAYATPAVLGGPRNRTMATQVYDFMVTILDWSMGSTFGAVLVLTSITLLFIAARMGSRRGAL